MKRLILLLAVITLAPLGAVGQQQRPRGSAVGTDRDLADALMLAKSGKYAEASRRLFQLSYSPRYRDRRMQIKYILGMTLHQMKLNQVAAFQFIGVVKEGNNKYIKQSLEKLSLAADSLGDDTLLNYAISRINVDEFPRVHRDMLHYRIGEYQMRNKQYEQAAQSFARVARGAGTYNIAKYQEGLALAESNQLDRALAAFEELMQARSAAPVNDKTKVAAQMGKARVLYQKKAWDESLEVYRDVPRDSEFWHDTVFESSWAMLRSGRFRSALSNFNTLHSAFYEDNYMPESLLLRSIVYLYICKYDEMDKTLTLFSNIYKPVYTQIDRTLQSSDNANRYFNMINDMMKMNKKGKLDKMSLPIPYIVAQKIVREADFQNSFQYIRKLMEERNRIKKLPGGWGASPVGQYSIKVLNTRIAKAKERAGKIVRNHLLLIREELVDQIEQEGFARYEMINGRKESLKKRIAGKDLPDQQIDESNKRDYYIQNGYEYWPFRGEYWLDELGNYHYVGTQSCN
ncbi:MAG: tetratricopeptide repeat protein [Bdellovibrionales bacterium]|nr:tetratricopeptide repeat protein [Bdellovibrionales bacterium]